MKVRLVIQAPQLVGDQLSVAIGIERRIGVDVDHRRHAAVVHLLIVRVDAERALLQRHVMPHPYALMHAAVATFDADRFR